MSYFLVFINRVTENHLLYFDWHSPAFWRHTVLLLPLEMLLFFQRWNFGWLWPCIDRSRNTHTHTHTHTIHERKCWHYQLVSETCAINRIWNTFLIYSDHIISSNRLLLLIFTHLEFMLMSVSLALYFGCSLLSLILKFLKAYILRLALRMLAQSVYGWEQMSC